MNLKTLLAQEKFLSARLEIVTEHDERQEVTYHTANLDLTALSTAIHNQL